MNSPAPYDLAPLVRIALFGLALASGPIAWAWMRHRHDSPAARLRALTALTLFLTFDLVLFGAFTRLTDSGLGCPDWPGCYGSASPFGARDQIHSAQSAMPGGPVSHGKAWIEMLHRYLATAVGVLITALVVLSWANARTRRPAVSPWWPTATLAWVCLQGAFGALTVTMKLYPAIVTLHLLGGFVLLALLAFQLQIAPGARTTALGEAPPESVGSLALTRELRLGVIVVAALVFVQAALGGWVSTNHALLACRDLPTCQGAWWPAMDFIQGFTFARELGAAPGGGYLPFAALTAIHVAHRLGACVVFVSVVLLGWRLHASGDTRLERWAVALGGVVAWQLASGSATVLLGWPLLAAVAHTAGAAALVTLLVGLLARAGILSNRGVTRSASGAARLGPRPVGSLPAPP